MAKTAEIRIAVLVGDNGRVAAVAINDGEEIDWALCADEIGRFEGNDIVYPDTERRYIITSTVELPEVREVRGFVEPSS